MRQKGNIAKKNALSTHATQIIAQHSWSGKTFIWKSIFIIWFSPSRYTWVKFLHVEMSWLAWSTIYDLVWSWNHVGWACLRKDTSRGMEILEIHVSTPTYNLQTIPSTRNIAKQTYGQSTHETQQYPSKVDLGKLSTRNRCLTYFVSQVATPPNQKIARVVVMAWLIRSIRCWHHVALGRLRKHISRKVEI